MPSRPTCLAILLYWLIASLGLFAREILPEFYIGSPPDLRSISLGEAEKPHRPVRWTIQVADDTKSPRSLRPVGQATTLWSRTLDGGFQLDSDVWFDPGTMLSNTPFAIPENVRVTIPSRFMISPAGNLQSFHVSVRSAADANDVLTLDGTVKNGAIEVKARGALPLLNVTRRFPYEPRGMIQSSVGPIDRLPGLQVGQRWRSQVVSPLTGRVETVQVEVAKKRVIQWGPNPITVLEVVQRMDPITARTWVRPDGLVIRQELPNPFVKLVIERQPE